MPVINRVVESLEELEAHPVDLVITDGDETLFPHNSIEPYPDVHNFLRTINAKHLSLVTANPDKNISKLRSAAIQADDVQTPDYPTWIKYRLFKRAINTAWRQAGHIESALVLGNRWFTDVAVARRVLHASGITMHRGVLLRRPDAHLAVEKFDRLFTSPAELAGATVLRKLGYDHLIRPPEDSRYA